MKTGAELGAKQEKKSCHRNFPLNSGRLFFVCNPVEATQFEMSFRPLEMSFGSLEMSFWLSEMSFCFTEMSFDLFEMSFDILEKSFGPF